jgi:hypothetical protein
VINIGFQKKNLNLNYNKNEDIIFIGYGFDLHNQRHPKHDTYRELEAIKVLHFIQRLFQLYNE